MRIGAIQKFSMVDYPGKLCAIIFTKGCNFRCPYCHNPELFGIKQKDVPTDEILEFLRKRIGKLDAVTITGGEPTIHADLFDLIKAIKAMGFLVKLDTNGTNPRLLRRLINESLVDYFAMDIKQTFKNYHLITRTKVDIKSIKQSIRVIINSGIDHEFRTTVVELLHSEADIIEIAEMIKSAKKFYLQKFVPLKVLDEGIKNHKTLSDDKFKHIEERIYKNFKVFAIR